MSTSWTGFPHPSMLVCYLGLFDCARAFFRHFLLRVTRSKKNQQVFQRKIVLSIFKWPKSEEFFSSFWWGVQCVLAIYSKSCQLFQRVVNFFKDLSTFSKTCQHFQRLVNFFKDLSTSIKDLSTSIKELSTSIKELSTSIKDLTTFICQHFKELLTFSKS